MKYRYRVLYYTYPSEPEVLSRLKEKLKNYTLLINPDKTSLYDALLMTAATSGEVIIVKSGETFLVAPFQEVPPGWSSGEEFLVGKERGLEKVAEDIVGRDQRNTAVKGFVIAGLVLIALYASYLYHVLDLVNNVFFLVGLILSLFGGLLRGYRKRRVRASAPHHTSE